MSAENVETVILDQNNKLVGFLKNIGGSFHITEAPGIINHHQSQQQSQTFQITLPQSNLIEAVGQQQQQHLQHQQIVTQPQILQCLNLDGGAQTSTQNQNAIISYIAAGGNEINLETQSLVKPLENINHDAGACIANASPQGIVLQNGTLAQARASGHPDTLGQQFSNMVFATINDSPIVDSTHQAEQHINFESVPIVEIPQTVAAEYEKPKTTCQYFCVPTLEELEERIRKHSEETFSHFVVAKKTKDFGTPVLNINSNSKFRVHWQSRDLTATEECAVQIPYEGTPFIYVGEKAYMCHLGRSKVTRSNKEANKEASAIPLIPPDLQVKKHRSRLTKKQGCPAKIFVKQIAKFPGFSIPSNSEYQRTQTSQKLRKALVSGVEPLPHIMSYVGTLPDIAEHKNHEIGESTPVREPIDLVIREKIIELAWKYGDGVLPSHIKDSLEAFVVDVLFKDKMPPSRQRRRFYPSERDISNYIYKAKLLTKISLHEINILSNQIKKLQEDHPELHVFFEIEIDGVNANPTTFSEDIALKYSTATLLNENRIVFCCQSPDQRRLLQRYGRQAVLLEISREANTPFPMYGVLVPTNVDYQLVYLFIVQQRNVQCIRDGFRKIASWNPDWKPKFLSVDHVKNASWKHLAAIEEFYPDCHIYINDESRQKAWTQWMENPFNSTTIQGGDTILYGKLEAIATAYTEDALNKAAQDLEDSEIWKLSENLREWFSSEWLAEAKRWVVGYRHEEFISMLHLPASTRLDDLQPIRDSHYSCIKSKKVGDFVQDYIKCLLPQCYQRYVYRNITDYRLQYAASKTPGVSIPSYMSNRPGCVLQHLRNQIASNGTAEYTVSQIQPGHFVVQDKRPDVTVGPYIVLFGSTDNGGGNSCAEEGVTAISPCCGCIDWLKYKLPCSHMVAIFHGFQSWDALNPDYTGNSIFELDFAVFDKEREERLVDALSSPAHQQMQTPQKSLNKSSEQSIKTLQNQQQQPSHVTIKPKDANNIMITINKSSKKTLKSNVDSATLLKTVTTTSISSTSTTSNTPQNISINKMILLVSPSKQVVLPLPIPSKGVVAECLTARQKLLQHPPQLQQQQQQQQQPTSIRKSIYSSDKTLVAAIESGSTTAAAGSGGAGSCNVTGGVSVSGDNTDKSFTVATSNNTQNIVVSDTNKTTTAVAGGVGKVVACENVCQELSNAIKRVDDPSMLKKVQSELEYVLNDVKMELSKLPLSPPPHSHTAPHPVADVGELNTVYNDHAIGTYQPTSSSTPASEKNSSITKEKILVSNGVGGNTTTCVYGKSVAVSTDITRAVRDIQGLMVATNPCIVTERVTCTASDAAGGVGNTGGPHVVTVTFQNHGGGNSNKRTRDQSSLSPKPVSSITAANTRSNVGVSCGANEQVTEETKGQTSAKKSKMVDVATAITMDNRHLVDDDVIESDVWIHDAELEIKLYNKHREEILNGARISYDIMVCAQKVLRHQFHDVTGFTDPKSLEMLMPTMSHANGSFLSNENAVGRNALQLHSVEGGQHWAVSARAGKDVRIFCCTLSSKASIMQQVMALSTVVNTAQGEGIGNEDESATGAGGDNILFIERSVDDTDACAFHCGVHAIAYCVAFAFEIEARNMLFDDTEMRGHFAECLEDMCFSMFPSLK